MFQIYVAGCADRRGTWCGTVEIKSLLLAELYNYITVDVKRELSNVSSTN